MGFPGMRLIAVSILPCQQMKMPSLPGRAPAASCCSDQSQVKALLARATYGAGLPAWGRRVGESDMIESGLDGAPSPSAVSMLLLPTPLNDIKEMLPS